MKTLPAFLPLAGLLLAGCASAGKFPKAPDGPYAADYALLQAETFNVSYSGEVRGLKDRGAESEWRRGAGAVAFVLNKAGTKAVIKGGDGYALITGPDGLPEAPVLLAKADTGVPPEPRGPRRRPGARP